MSNRIKSGCSSSALRTASNPSDTSQMTFSSGAFENREQKKDQTLGSLAPLEPEPATDKTVQALVRENT